jgi:hypothetical protein
VDASWDAAFRLALVRFRTRTEYEFNVYEFAQGASAVALVPASGLGYAKRSRAEQPLRAAFRCIGPASRHVSAGMTIRGLLRVPGLECY